MPRSYIASCFDGSYSLLLLLGFRRDYEERAETPQEYADRLRRQREEQEAAARRREHEARVRRERAEYEREQGESSILLTSSTVS